MSEKCLVGEISVGEISVGEMFVCETSARQNVCLRNVCGRNVLVPHTHNFTVAVYIYYVLSLLELLNGEEVRLCQWAYWLSYLQYTDKNMIHVKLHARLIEHTTDPRRTPQMGLKPADFTLFL